MNRFSLLLSLLVFASPNLLPDADAGLFFRRCGEPRTPIRTAARAVGAVARAPVAAVGAWSRSRAARGLPAVFPAVAAAAGATSCGSCGVASAESAAAPTCRVLPDGSVVCEVPQAAASRRSQAETTAGVLDGQFGHRAGRGPLRRALNASPEHQRRIIERFNSTIGARSGTFISSITELIEWLATHQSEVLAVVKLVVQIIGLF